MKMRDRLKLAKDNAGLTLVEVIVSITILACISIPLMAYFSQSLQYSAVTAKQQKATTLAQNLTEGLKSQQSLLRVVSGDSSLYTVPYLDKTGMYTITAVSGGGVTSTGQPCFRVDPSGLPIGSLKYTANLYETGTSVSSSSVSGNTRKYSVDITLSTISDLNSGNHPILYGMDDSTDVIAIEDNQITTAIMYFKSINAAYGGGTLSDAQIRNKMKRTIVVDFDYIIDGSDTYYQIEVYYNFACKELRGPSDTTTVDKITTTPLNYTKIASPKNLYIMFNRLHPVVDTGDCDRIMFHVSDSIKNVLGSAGFKLPELYLIIQNLSDDTTQYITGDYKIALGMDSSFSGMTLNNIKIHTNTVEVNDTGHRNFKYAKFVDGSSYYSINAEDSINLGASPDISDNKISEVTDKGPLLRTVNILTEVYELKTDGTRGDLLASYSSSKGE